MFNKDNHLFIIKKAQALYEKSSSDTLGDFPEEIRNEFHKNGSRTGFEKLYFRRRDYLSATAILALSDGGYTDELEKIILAVCDEKSWMLPAHTIHGDGFIDLFIAETSFALAEIISVFGDRLSPEIHGRVKDEIRKRLAESYSSGVYWWESCSMNWAAVCGAYIGGTLLYLFPEEFEKQKDRIKSTLKCYIDGFSDDGFCLEGPSYWQYGFTAFSVFADLIYRYTDGKENLFSDEKVKKIASYGSRCLLKGNTAVSFSDSDRSFRQDCSLQNYLHRLFPETVPLRSDEEPYLYDANTKWINYYRAYLWADSDSKASDFREREIYSPLANQLIINKKSYSFAFKGGNNGEPHNHNDLGSFIYSDKNGQVFCDLGSGRYTKDYFDDSKRYGIFCNSSLSHSVPIIDRKAQSFGKDFTAKLTYENGTAVCDIAKAYDINEITSFIRKTEIREDGISITDTFAFEKFLPVTERFISLKKAEIKNGLLLFGNTKMLYPCHKVYLSVKEERHTPHEYDAEYITVYCYDFLLKEGVNEITFEITTE